MKQWEDLGIENDFLFSKVMRKAELCKNLLTLILNTEIEKIEYIQPQKTIDEFHDSKGIRLDLYIKNSNGRVYDVEMQTTNSSLPKRTRYYQSLMDMEQLEKGDVYTKLKETYIIFICTQDVFSLGRAIYTFKQTCQEEKGLLLEDGTTTLFLNSKGKNKGNSQEISEGLRAFLNYLETKKATDDFTRKLKKEVAKAKNNKEWRNEYMLKNQRELLIKEESREEERELNKRMFKLYKKGLSYEEIAKRCNIEVEKVKDFFEE